MGSTTFLRPMPRRPRLSFCRTTVSKQGQGRRLGLGSTERGLLQRMRTPISMFRSIPANIISARTGNRTAKCVCPSGRRQRRLRSPSGEDLLFSCSGHSSGCGGSRARAGRQRRRIGAGEDVRLQLVTRQEVNREFSHKPIWAVSDRWKRACFRNTHASEAGAAPMHTRRFARLTNALSKNIAHHLAANARPPYA